MLLLNFIYIWGSTMELYSKYFVVILCNIYMCHDGMLCNVLLDIREDIHFHRILQFYGACLTIIFRIVICVKSTKTQYFNFLCNITFFYFISFSCFLRHLKSNISWWFDFFLLRSNCIEIWNPSHEHNFFKKKKINK